MNREHREGYERGETEPTNFRDFPVFRGIFPGTLPFSGKGSPLPGKKGGPAPSSQSSFGTSLDFPLPRGYNEEVPNFKPGKPLPWRV